MATQLPIFFNAAPQVATLAREPPISGPLESPFAPGTISSVSEETKSLMAIKKVDDSYTIIPFGVKGDNFKTKQLQLEEKRKAKQDKKK